MENLTEYIKPELLVLVAVLYILGLMIKGTKKIKDNYIPVILGVAGIALSTLYVVATEGFNLLGVFTGVTQGILVAGVAVYVNQLIKQTKEK
jgi:hypothetical protein